VVEADRAIRRAWATRRSDRVDEELTEFAVVDEGNAAWPRQVVAEHGWLW
jgi:hypothetical protein